MTAVAKSYWRSIKRGTRAFAALPAEVQGDVRALARQDLDAGGISAAQYETLIGGAKTEVTDNGGQ